MMRQDELSVEKEEYSARNISLRLGYEDDILLYGQFLDEFYRKKTKEQKYQLLKDEPMYRSEYALFLCLLAGSVEKLAKDNDLPIPKWTEKPEYTFNKIYYAYDTQNKEFQEFLVKTTPLEYKKRNLMVGDTVLRRC